MKRLFELRQFVDGGLHDSGEVLCYIYAENEEVAREKAAAFLEDKEILKYKTVYSIKPISNLPHQPPVIE